jgi:hypothetical protein
MRRDAKMNKLVKILLAYYSPYFLFLAYSLFASPDQMNRLETGILSRVLSVYWIAGLVIVPLLAYGIPSRAGSITAELSSPRIREAFTRKLLLTAASLGVVLVMVLTVRLVPPKNAASLIFDVIILLTGFCLLIWMRFRRRSG